MQCPQCDAENKEGRRFCAKCGAPLAVACKAWQGGPDRILTGFSAVLTHRKGASLRVLGDSPSEFAFAAYELIESVKVPP